MMILPSTTAAARTTRRARRLAVMLGVLAALASTAAMAQAPGAESAVSVTAPFSAEELEQLVGPIALYPDDLVALVLPAATNPLQVVQADRFLEKRKQDPKLAVDDKWDDAIKNLLNYPDVVKKMSSDLDWTAMLGEAVVTDQGEVLEAVQSFRRKTVAAGNLKTDDKQKVVVEKEVVQIVPANPEVIYVPQYNPTTVVVSGPAYPYSYYPTPYPVYYYPYAPGAAFATGLIWGAAMGAIWSGGRYNTNWGGGGNNNINIDVDRGDRNVDRGDRNVDRSRTTNTAGDRGGNRGGGGQSQAWSSNKKPGQVSGSAGVSAGKRPGDTRTAGAGGARAGTQPAGGARGGAQPGGGAGAGGAGGARAGTQPAAGNRSSGGGSAFDGGGSGRQTQMDSSRGASSRSAAGASSRPAPSASTRSAPSRSAGGGGGGGGGRGGGGGGRGGGGRR